MVIVVFAASERSVTHAIDRLSAPRSIASLGGMGRAGGRWRRAALSSLETSRFSPVLALFSFRFICRPNGPSPSPTSSAHKANSFHSRRRSNSNKTKSCVHHAVKRDLIFNEFSSSISLPTFHFAPTKSCNPQEPTLLLPFYCS